MRSRCCHKQGQSICPCVLVTWEPSLFSRPVTERSGAGSKGDGTIVSRVLNLISSVRERLFNTSFFFNLKRVYMCIVVYLSFKVKSFLSGFPGGSVVQNPPANAGDSLTLDSERSHMLQSNKVHALQLLSLCSRAWEP